MRSNTCCKRTSTHPRPAFTLVEMLVVIAVIGGLVALLMPALAGATRSARQAVCLSQQHQLGLGITNYSNDFAGFAPPMRISSSSSLGLIYGQIAWEDVVCDYLGVTMTDTDKARQSFNLTTIRPYSVVANTFLCPNDTERNGSNYIRTSYSINHWQQLRRDNRRQASLSWGVQLGPSSFEGRSRRIPMIRNAEAFIMLAEKGHISAFCFGYSQGAYTPAIQGDAPSNGTVLQGDQTTFHGGPAWDSSRARWNYLFADAHASTLNPYSTVTTASHATNNPTTNQDTSGMWTEEPND